MNKYLYPIILYLAVVIPNFFLQIIALGSEGVENITYLIPFNFIIDAAYGVFFSPIIMIILIQCLSVVLSLFFFKIHRVINFNRYDYFILNENYVKLSYWSMTKRVLLFGFLTFSLGIFLSQVIPENIIIAPSPSQYESPSLFFKAITVSYFILPFLILFIEPIWLLQDSSIICSLKPERRKKERRLLPEMEGIYYYFQSSLSGYVGLGALIAIILLMFDALRNVNLELGEIVDIPGIFLTPLMLSVIPIPALVFHELRLNIFRKKLINKLKQKGVKSINKVQEIF
ncbi:MAG: hypothetical protein ACFFKA_17830 [Candidatus Thorarchaeota archaeon]